ncbi:MAG TPA: dTDP-4-dehydrorhamnose 3,5-epimerase, partial [Polyangiaceae bacterium]|nr:dTDP-4-dehydrorhamnose 3,5-epimerase [Polyangiaceae bacterium]
PTYGKWVGEELSEENHRQLWIPPGFAHGFVVLSETAHFAYKCTVGYHPETELSVRFDDPGIGIPWPDLEYKLSAKDEAAQLLSDIPRERLPIYEEPKVEQKAPSWEGPRG